VIEVVEFVGQQFIEGYADGQRVDIDLSTGLIVGFDQDVLTKLREIVSLLDSVERYLEDIDVLSAEDEMTKREALKRVRRV